MKYLMKEKFNKLRKLKDWMNKLRLKKKSLIRQLMYNILNQEIK